MSWLELRTSIIYCAVNTGHNGCGFLSSLQKFS
ncbi:hypothetical protein CY0110_18317 [Crocosphaera chwakensis CCY0110]|uniref:Uncharacterized protein n=1 Tax=Crocosphaera chwakensis CCY0110 TaxID=391612 RepID=A3IIZ5_9CHRO|nr:hypothetical protein CY0110_18317 [Crocosphaera chwakensis CCY0110]